MDDVGSLGNILLVPQLKTDIISEGKLMRENDWVINSRGLWKRVVDDAGDVLMGRWIVDGSNLYAVYPA